MLLDITDVAEKLLIKVRFGIFIRKVPKNMWTLLQNMLKVHAGTCCALILQIPGTYDKCREYERHATDITNISNPCICPTEYDAGCHM